LALVEHLCSIYSINKIQFHCLNFTGSTTLANQSQLKLKKDYGPDCFRVKKIVFFFVFSKIDFIKLFPS
jgi:hypothetical protein